MGIHMANGFEKAFEEMLRRVLREEIAALPASSAPAPAPAASAAQGGTSGGQGLGAMARAVSSILQPTGQTEIMTALLKAATELFGRCVLFVKRGDTFSAWRAEGFSGNTASALRSVAVSSAEPGMFKEASDSRAPVCRRRTAGALPSVLEQALGSAVGPNLCVLPLVVQGKVVAALYSDAGGTAGSEEMSGLEVLTRVAGLSLETSASRATAGSSAEAATPAPVETPPLETSKVSADVPPQRGSFAATFPVASEGASAPLPDVESMDEGARDSHKKAHRFARVAVQDLLSYHKDKIETGRRNRNLFNLLKEDIEKTRENYQKRFGQTPARSFDYLHYEMVSKLAGNDIGLLGEQYPGPVGEGPSN
jgi:hypothetical protein